jgi:hypothetical protein
MINNKVSGLEKKVSGAGVQVSASTFLFPDTSEPDT